MRVTPRAVPGIILNGLTLDRILNWVLDRVNRIYDLVLYLYANITHKMLDYFVYKYGIKGEFVYKFNWQMEILRQKMEILSSIG